MLKDRIAINKKLQELLFPAAHPYHHSTIGSMDDLNAATVEDAAAFFRIYYAPNNASLAIVGDIDKAVDDRESFVDAVNKIVQDMHDDGTLTAMSEKWYNGIDLTTH